MLIIDPPYPFTQTDSYKMQSNFGFIELVHLIRNIRPPFILFGLCKDFDFLEFFEYWINSKFENWESLEGYQLDSKRNSVNYAYKTRREVMIHKL